MDKEEDYELILVVKAKGHGTKAQQRKDAATIKRILDVKLAQETEVFLMEEDSPLRMAIPLTEVTWPAPGMGSVG